MEGILEFLLSYDPAAMKLRETYIFKIIPMLNPDGVISGSHRANLAGLDLNRTWMDPQLSTAPEIFAAKQIWKEYANSRKRVVVCYFCNHSYAVTFMVTLCERTCFYMDVRRKIMLIRRPR